MVSRCTPSGCLITKFKAAPASSVRFSSVRPPGSMVQPTCGPCEKHVGLPPLFFAGSHGETMWVRRFCVDF